MTAHSPASLAASYVAELLHQVPSVRNGDVEGVHQARVATRRLREVAPLLAPRLGRRAENLERLARRAGRRLGRVRELDVMHETLAAFEAQVPVVAEVAAVARQNVESRTRRARRRLIKALERLELDRLSSAAHTWGGLRDRYASGRSLAILRERLGARAKDVRDAVNHAGGVYFPNRLHRARVAVKRLRYAVEIADAIGLWRPPNLLRDLRRIQATLGLLHDMQVLSDRLDRFVDDESTKTQAAILRGVIEGKIAEEFESYRERRERLLAICDVVERFASPRHGLSRRNGSLLALSAMAFPVGVMLLGARVETKRRRAA